MTPYDRALEQYQKKMDPFFIAVDSVDEPIFHCRTKRFTFNSVKLWEMATEAAREVFPVVHIRSYETHVCGQESSVAYSVCIPNGWATTGSFRTAKHFVDSLQVAYPGIFTTMGWRMTVLSEGDEEYFVERKYPSMGWPGWKKGE
jgi:hypothetical protein